MSIPTCAWVLGRWLLSLSPNVFLQFSSHYRVGRTGQEWAIHKTGEKKNTYGLGEGKKTVTEAIQELFFLPWSSASTFVCVYNKGWSGWIFNKCVVLSELKKACSRGRDSIQPSMDHCCLIQLAPLHPRTLCNLISLLYSPPPSILLSSPHSFSCLAFSNWFRNAEGYFYPLSRGCH